MSSGTHQVDAITAGELRFPARAALCGAIITVPWILRWQSVPNPDVSWLLVAARQWLDTGAVYGRDIIEINTPLALLLHVPPIWLARMSGLPVFRSVDLWFLLLLFSAALAAGRVASTTTGRSPRSVFGSASVAAIMAVFALYPIFEFGERDILVSALLLPYCLLHCNFDPTTPDLSGHRFVPTVMAGLGCCLKPQFAVIVAAVLLLSVARHGFRNGIQRAHLPLLAGMAVLYVSSIVLFFPDWLAMFVRLSKVYAIVRDSPPYIFKEAFSSIFLAFACLAVSFVRIPGRSLLRAACVPAFVVIVELFLEGRAWSYRIMPITLFALAGLAFVLVSSLSHLRALSIHRWAVPGLILSIAGYLVIATISGVRSMRYEYEYLPLATKVREMAKPTDSVLFLSGFMAPVFFLLIEEGRPYPIGYPGLWDLSAVAIGTQMGRLSPAEAEPYATAAIARATADLVTHRPKLIAIEDRNSLNQLYGNVSLIEQLQGDPKFLAEMKNYKRWGEATDYVIYLRSAP